MNEVISPPSTICRSVFGVYFKSKKQESPEVISNIGSGEPRKPEPELIQELVADSESSSSFEQEQSGDSSKKNKSILGV